MLSGRGRPAGSVHGVRVGVCPRVGLVGWLRWLAHTFGDGVCRGHAQYPAFVPDFFKVTFGLFFVSVSGHPEFAPTTQLFLVPYNFFAFGHSRRLSSGPAAKGPRSQRVSKGPKGKEGGPIKLVLWGLQDPGMKMGTSAAVEFLSLSPLPPSLG